MKPGERKARADAAAHNVARCIREIFGTPNYAITQDHWDNLMAWEQRWMRYAKSPYATAPKIKKSH